MRPGVNRAASTGAPRQVQRRIDDSAADMGTLVDLGLAEEQPEPQYTGLFLEPDIPPAVDVPE